MKISHKTGAEIRQSFIDYFVSKGHTFIPSSSLVPGGDQTLLFTNAGMVQFKDVFLGEDQRPYTRVANSQKCMRVAGKHNDLDDVGRDDTHHTFFEMLGNWSFGDYYKEEAISWAWELLTEVWGIEKSILWATCFKDDKSEIPADEEAASYWKKQPGMNPAHILYFGRKENFWEMADTGPCGPCSEIHIDLGEAFCDKKGIPGHVCSVNGDCKRFLELWNLVFMQYNRLSPSELEPLPACHVDTGMGLERIVAVLQGVYSNYKTDLFTPIMDEVQKLTGHNDDERQINLTPYRVISDHGRAAAFLIADGVIPGNTGRNYVCRMIIRRAARFGSKIGLTDPFLAQVADRVIAEYGNAYPELVKNRHAILESLTREERRFQRTVEAGVSHLAEMLQELKDNHQTMLDGHKAFDLYATHGLPLELTRDIAREQNLDVGESGFQEAMEEHRLISGAGKAFGPLGGENVDVYRVVFENLLNRGDLDSNGVEYNPYGALEVEGSVLALLHEGQQISTASEGQTVEVVLPETCFYLESGGQVADSGTIVSVSEPRWEIIVSEARRPAAGIIIHLGEVLHGTVKVGDEAIAAVDAERRKDIMRNHTATHLLHAELHVVLGEHARQAGSLVAPDRLRFDFTHPEALSTEQLEKIEEGVNRAILSNFSLTTRVKPLSDAIAEGATALFGEKYGEIVRTVSIGGAESFSYELCGGTHVGETGDIGSFLIISEGSAAAGIRRIEAVTGRGAYELIQKHNRTLKRSAWILNSAIDEIPARIQTLLDELDHSKKEAQKIRQDLVTKEFEQILTDVPNVKGIPFLSAIFSNADAETLRQMADRFRKMFTSGCIVLGSDVNGRPIIIASVTEDLVNRGINAIDLVKDIATIIGGSGGGKPGLAQAGGKDSKKLAEALDRAKMFISNRL